MARTNWLSRRDREIGTEESPPVAVAGGRRTVDLALDVARADWVDPALRITVTLWVSSDGVTYRASTSDTYVGGGLAKDDGLPRSRALLPPGVTHAKATVTASGRDRVPLGLTAEIV